MKKLLIIFIILLASTRCWGDEVIIDQSGWSQEQKNMTQAMVVILLHKNSVTFDSIKVVNGVVTITNPSGNLGIITKQAIENEYSAWKIISDQANVTAQAEEQAKQDEINASELKNISLAQIDTRIDSINNLAEMKIFLKKLVRYIKAKGL